MFEMLEYILPSNRRGMDEYLFHLSFWRIELILRSTRSVNPKLLSDPDLVRYTEKYTTEEEKRLEKNLEGVGYELDTTATVSLVTGEGRIERVGSFSCFKDIIVFIRSLRTSLFTLSSISC
jgi:hypothetical protein